MGTELWIFLLFYVANSRVLAQEELYCTDPDTGLRYSVNSSWPATKFCGSYTCHVKSVQGLQHTEIHENYNDNKIHRGNNPTEFYDIYDGKGQKNEFRPYIYGERLHDAKMELNDKSIKQSFAKNQFGNDNKKTLNKPFNGNYHDNAHVHKPPFYNYDGQLHVIKNDPLLIEIFKEYNKYLAKFIEYYPHEMYKFNNLQNTKRVKDAESSSTNNAVDSIKMRTDYADNGNDDVEKSQHYYNHWMQFYLTEYKKFKTKIEQTVSNDSYRFKYNPFYNNFNLNNYNNDTCPSASKNIEQVDNDKETSTESNDRHKHHHHHHRHHHRHSKKKNDTTHDLNDNKNINNSMGDISYLYFNPATGEYTKERPSDFTYYLKFFDEYMNKYLKTHPASKEQSKISPYDYIDDLSKSSQIPSIKSNGAKTQDKWHDFKHSEDIVEWKAKPYVPSGLQGLRQTIQDNKFDRINSKLAQLGLPGMPQPLPVPKLISEMGMSGIKVRPSNFAMPLYKTLKKRTISDEEDENNDKLKTYITVQGCPEAYEPGYFKMGDAEKRFPHCCPQKIDKNV